MTDKPYNLKVRVNMAPDDIVKPKKPEPKPQYLWGRILVVGLVLLALAWGAFKLVSWLLAPAEPVTDASMEATSDEMANVETGLLPGRKPTGDARSIEDQAEAALTETASEASVTESPAEAIESAGASVALSPAATPEYDEPPQAVAVPEIADPQPVAQAESETEEPVAPSQASSEDSELNAALESRVATIAPEPAAVAAPVAGRNSLFTPGSGDILSTQVKRFVLTNGIKDREPLAGIEAIRPDSGDNGIVTVYAFSEVSGLQGQTLRYRWLRNGNAVATVKVGVGGSKWRSYSSKYVTSAMQGDWRVELLGTNGEVLAFREFEY